MSWPSARNVLVPAGEAVTFGEIDGAAVEDTGALGDPADVGDPADDPADVGEPAGVLAVPATGELVDELQADTSNAAPASTAPAATCRALREFAVKMDSHPLTSIAALRARS